jgi:hypothetical protein
MLKFILAIGTLLSMIAFASPVLADNTSWGSCQSAIQSCNERDGEYKRLTDLVASACKEIKSCNLSKKKWKAEKTKLKSIKKFCKKKCNVDFKLEDAKVKGSKKACKKLCNKSYDKGWSNLLSDQRATNSKRFCRQMYQSQECQRARTELGGYLTKYTLSCGASLFFGCNAK